jgi:hypothetical protein
MPTADEFAPVHFSTWDLPERERLPRWQEEFGRRIVGVEIEPLQSGAPFRAEAALQALPGARIASCTGSAARLTRTSALAADGDDSIGLVVNFGAELVMSQRDRDATLRPGEALLLMHQEPAVLTHGDVRFHGLVFPRTALVSRMRDMDAAMMRRIPRSVEPLRLLVGYLDLIGREATLATPELRQNVAGHIHDLVGLAFGANRDTQQNGLNAVAAAQLASALEHIAQRFTEEADVVAAGQARQGASTNRCSPRRHARATVAPPGAAPDSVVPVTDPLFRLPASAVPMPLSFSLKAWKP